MKKLILVYSLILMFAFTACNNKSNEHNHQEGEEATHQHDSISTDDTTAQAAYICPMKCEGSASNQPGKCPVCKMDLVAVEELENEPSEANK